jgi:hypothetical protein
MLATGQAQGSWWDGVSQTGTCSNMPLTISLTNTAVGFAYAETSSGVGTWSVDGSQCFYSPQATSSASPLPDTVCTGGDDPDCVCPGADSGYGAVPASLDVQGNTYTIHSQHVDCANGTSDWTVVLVVNGDTVDITEDYTYSSDPTAGWHVEGTLARIV